MKGQRRRTKGRAMIILQYCIFSSLLFPSFLLAFQPLCLTYLLPTQRLSEKSACDASEAALALSTHHRSSTAKAEGEERRQLSVYLESITSYRPIRFQHPLLFPFTAVMSTKSNSSSSSSTKAASSSTSAATAAAAGGAVDPARLPSGLESRGIPHSDKQRWKVIYPIYLNVKKKISEGRKLPKQYCVERPSVYDIADMCVFLKLPYVIEVRTGKTQ